MTVLKYIVGIAGIIAGILSGVFWMRAASAIVKAAPTANEGVAYGGKPVYVRDHKGTLVDFLQTYSLQSKWNSRAALMSAATAILAAITFLLALIS